MSMFGLLCVCVMADCQEQDGTTEAEIHTVPCYVSWAVEEDEASLYSVHLRICLFVVAQTRHRPRNRNTAV